LLLRAAGGRAPSRLEEIAVGWTLSGRRAEWGVQPAAGGKESPDVPGGDVGDQLEGAADGREGGAGQSFASDASERVAGRAVAGAQNWPQRRDQILVGGQVELGRRARRS
jgi:hypothetical protein